MSSFIEVMCMVILACTFVFGRDGIHRALVVTAVLATLVLLFLVGGVR